MGEARSICGSVIVISSAGSCFDHMAVHLAIGVDYRISGGREL